MTDYAAARHNMVESQIRPNKVSDTRLIAALDEVPRERFVPKRLQGVAYVDEDIAIAPGRYIMEPMVLARLLQACAVRPDDVVLDVACGTGYAAAVLAKLAGTVVSLEPSEELAEAASRTLAAIGADNVIVVTGPLAQGYARQAPYDVIMIGGGIDHLPEALIGQLAEGGRLLAVLRAPGRVGEATLWEKHHGSLSSRPLFEAAVPALPGIESPRGFEF